jgi:hypothetical protein
VEQWLDLLQKSMVEVLMNQIRDGIADLADPKYKVRNNWVLGHIGQVVSVVSHISWCNATESTIDDMEDNPVALEEFYEQNLK